MSLFPSSGLAYRGMRHWEDAGQEVSLPDKNTCWPTEASKRGLSAGEAADPHRAALAMTGHWGDGLSIIGHISSSSLSGREMAPELIKAGLSIMES